MSGIYTRGMEMPKSCVECRFGSIESCNETEPLIIRCIVLDNFTHEVDWNEVCPLIEVPPHGRWEKKNDGIMIWWECSECHHDAWYDKDELYRYCPWCGTKMDMDDAPTIIESEE